MKGERTKINTLAEKEKLAKFLLERLEQLKEKEKIGGEYLAETRETVTALCVVLDKIRMESSGIVENPDEMKDRIFADWMAKIDNKDKVKREESQVSE